MTDDIKASFSKDHYVIYNIKPLTDAVEGLVKSTAQLFGVADDIRKGYREDVCRDGLSDALSALQDRVYELQKVLVNARGPDEVK